jgi:2-keto-4-pentenoate hydratase/2-oxohepta-3-ene-1,7-dioic acid hydratase in catechol pathway
MKLVRIGPPGEEQPAVLADDGTLLDLRPLIAVVNRQTARYLATPDDAAAVIAGYTISSDVSERTFQLDRGGHWDKGKCCETFNPRRGDTMRLEIDGLGAQQQTLGAA